VVAKIVPNTKTMAVMDNITFISNDKANVYFMSCSMYDNYDPEALTTGFKQIIR
jgi:hypothetical protein